MVLQQLYDEVDSEHVTLAWLMGRLDKRSYGLLMLVLALVAAVPGICMLGGLLLMIPASQMIAGARAPVFPRCIADHPLPLRHFGALLQWVIPVLKRLEKLTRPRWHTVLEATKPAVGVVVLILSGVVVLAPIPLLNIIPALAIALISLAYLEEDGLVLCISLAIGIILLSVAGVAVREAVLRVRSLGDLWAWRR